MILNPSVKKIIIKKKNIEKKRNQKSIKIITIIHWELRPICATALYWDLP